MPNLTLGELVRANLYMAGQRSNAVAITGGTINGTTIGATTPAAGHFTDISFGDFSSSTNAIIGYLEVGTSTGGTVRLAVQST